MIKLGYINIQGLNQSKFHSCITLLDSGLFDILFLAEHWFIKSFSYRQHPYCIVESSFDPSFERTTHTRGGILVMAHPRVNNLIRSFSSSLHFISLSLTEVEILAVYLPPSIVGPHLETILASLPPAHILVGDINCRFAGIASSKRYSPSSLQECWHRFRLDTGLQTIDPLSIPPSLSSDIVSKMLRSESGHLRDAADEILLKHIDDIPLAPSFELDHIFIHPRLYDRLSVHLYETEFFKFKTDHKYMIAFEIQSPPLHPDVHDVESITGRYHLKRLSNQKTLELFRNRWSELSESRRHEYFTCTDVDVLNDSLTGMVGDISAEVLGVYHVPQTKTKTDTYSQDLMKSPKAVAAIQLFKRHMRSQTNHHRIVPMDEKGDVMQECIAPLQISSTTPPQLTTVARLNYIIPIPRTMSYLFYGSISYGISSKSILSTKPAVMMAFTPSCSVPCYLRLSQSSSSICSLVVSIRSSLPGIGTAASSICFPSLRIGLPMRTRSVPSVFFRCSDAYLSLC